MMVSKQNQLLQVQPQYDRRAQWTALSQQEGLFFEALEFSLAPAAMDSGAREGMLAWYAGCGRVQSLHGAFIDVNPASGDADFRDLSRKRCHESCRIAKKLGAQHVVFHSSAFPFLRGDYLKNWAACCADFYTELAQTYRLSLHIENSQDVDAEPLRALMGRIRGADVSVCLDLGHANYSRASLEEWFGELGESIRYLHLSDNMGHFDDHLPIGSGSVNWERAHALWRQLRRSVPITLEVGGESGVEASLKYLKSNRYFGIEESQIEGS